MLYTVKELNEKMIDLADFPTVYTTKWLKRKIIEKYDQNVFFAEMKGRSDVVCLKIFADLIVNNAWYEMREKDLKKESERIINTAAKLILSGVRSINLESDIYPLENEIADINICKNLLLKSLRKFLEVLTKNRLKRVAIGQVLQNLNLQFFRYHSNLGLKWTICLVHAGLLTSYQNLCFQFLIKK